MDRIDPIDLALLDGFQRDFPLESRPFARIGERLGLAEAEVIDRLSRMQATGRIARVGGTVRPNTAGASTLAALAVPEDRIEAVAAIVGAEPGVNHSYQREDDWNLWFVATAPDAAALEQMLARIEAASGLQLLDLRLVRAFNIDLGFPLKGDRVAMPGGRHVETTVLRGDDRPLLDALSCGLDLTPRPWATLALRLGRDETAVLSRIGVLLAAGILTRLGVIVRHRSLGFTSNAMVVWDVPETATLAAGQALAALPGVTLAYERRPIAGVWPYRLYCMIHARSRAEAGEVLATARALPALQGVDHRVLFSTRCFKQSGARLSEAA
ncbi:AsnC family transcriptional regulator [Tabrizicola sp.]|uniref:siroheme decarboxylase subunit beta n=1 Tax=Tabrizicola sp. TaxID=2005166 RepID=UPI001A4360FD|nr:AsnC family transcriptional regulator [Tabrizicola sp.]MBL9072857.1 AsnC family transcriptional regulator [Tabrizicola sp.]